MNKKQFRDRAAAAHEARQRKQRELTANDRGALLQALADKLNIPRDEAQHGVLWDGYGWRWRCAGLIFKRDGRGDLRARGAQQSMWRLCREGWATVGRLLAEREAFLNQTGYDWASPQEMNALADAGRKFTVLGVASDPENGGALMALVRFDDEAPG